MKGWPSELPGARAIQGWGGGSSLGFRPGDFAVEGEDGGRGGSDGNERDGPEEGPEVHESCAFQEDALDEFQAVPHGVEQGEVLEEFRHAGDGRGEARRA